METGILFLELLNSLCVFRPAIYLFSLFTHLWKKDDNYLPHWKIYWFISLFSKRFMTAEADQHNHTSISSGQDPAAQLIPAQTAVSTSSVGELRLFSGCPIFFPLPASDFLYLYAFLLPWSLCHCVLWPKKQQAHRLVITVGRWSCVQMTF